MRTWLLPLLHSCLTDARCCGVTKLWMHMTSMSSPMTCDLSKCCGLCRTVRVPNHRVPLAEQGVQEARDAGLRLRQLVGGEGSHGTFSGSNGQGQVAGQAQPPPRLFVYTSPYLRCIQTMQHMLTAGKFTNDEVRQRHWYCQVSHQCKQYFTRKLHQ